MPFTSVGYDGIIDEVSWARMQPALGRWPYGVDGNSWVPSIVTGTTVPKVRIQAGSGFGWGVHDLLDVDTDITVTTPPTTAGATRWDTFVVRRNWTGVGGATSLLTVVGGATAVVSGTIQNTPGTQADQPIALVQTTGGSAVATDLIDLRGWPTHVIFWPHADPPQASRYKYGQHVMWTNSTIGGCLLVRRGNPGSEIWDNLDDPDYTNLNVGGGIVAGTSTPQYRVRRGMVEMRGNGRRAPTSNNGIWAAGTGAIEVLVGTLPSNLAPAVHTAFVIACEGGIGGAVRTTVNTAGQINCTIPATEQMTGVYYTAITYPVKTGL